MANEITEARLLAWVQEGVRVAEQALNSLDAEAAAHTAAGLSRGGEVELRLRLRPAMPPRVSVVLIGDKGEVTLRNSDDALLGGRH